ncbi:hypothetical protein F5Y15DRAFT_403208 [Xylariaceae sp. FL0016]|nr:hypothetical protein F5Y15DRAFT_403208 [Xylariaceae sp. FL0016]
MGLGTKLKDALSGDKDTKHVRASDTSKTPGSFPSEETPRTYNNTSDERWYGADHKHGADSNKLSDSDYTYDRHAGNSFDGALDDDERPITGLRKPHATTDKSSPKYRHGKTHSGDAATVTQSARHERGDKFDTATPYWGDEDADRNFSRPSRGTQDSTGGLDEQRHGKGQGTYNGVTGTGSGRPADATHSYGERRSLDQGRERGGISGLPHRGRDADPNARTREYDAPTSSDTRGHSGAGVGTFGASQVAGRHHDQDLQREGYGSKSNDYDDIHGTKPGMLDPYGTQPSAHSQPTQPMQQSQGYAQTKHMAPDSGYTGGPGSIGDRSSNNSEHGHGSGFGTSGLGPDHYGPGHAGAKVMHQCDHCGRDNDISKYFRKEAVYRMS